MTHKKNDTSNPTQNINLQAAPHDAAMEQAVLGACLLDFSALHIVQDILTTPDAFYLQNHQQIYMAMLDLAKRGIPVDLLTVTQHLRQHQTAPGSPALDAFYLVELTNRVASTANLETHARVVKQYHVQRQVGMYALRMYSQASGEHSDIFDLLGECEQGLLEITKGLPGGQAQSMAQLTSELLRQTEEAMMASQRGEFTGVPSGVQDLDRATGGWQPGQLIILAARPGMGKTSFAVNNLAQYPASLGMPVGILSLEMTKTALTARMAAPIAGLTTNQLRSGQLTDDDLRRLVSACEQVGQLPIFIDDEPGIGIAKVRAKARQMVRKYGIKLLVIDYLQLLDGSTGTNAQNRNQEITHITTSLKALAKSLGIAIVALSQLSRDVEKRADKRPLLSDLRDGGSIEQDSDDVLFLYREAYYNASADDSTELITAKRRDGKIGTTMLRFEAAATRFVDAAQERTSALFSGRQVPGVVDFSQPRYDQPADFFLTAQMPRQEPKHDSPFF